MGVVVVVVAVAAAAAAVAVAVAVAVVVVVVHEVLSFIEFDMSSHLFVAVADTMTTASAVKVC